MLESNGIVSLSWTNHGGVQSRKVALASNVPLTVECGQHGGVVASIDFVSFGTPTEQKATLEKQSTQFVQDSFCHASYRTLYAGTMETSCVGKNKCVFAVSPHLFEALPDACHEDFTRPLSLWVQTTCSLPLSVEIQVAVPLGSLATIDLPMYRLKKVNDAQKIQIEESGSLLSTTTTKQTTKDFIDHPGVLTAQVIQDHAQRDVARVAVGSGKYHFMVRVQE